MARWRAILRSRALHWTALILGLLLLVEYGPALWPHLGFSGRYQIAALGESWVVRLDTKTGQLDLFLLGPPEVAKHVPAHTRLWPVPKP